MLNLKYLAGAMLAIPILPIMYFQGKKIRARVSKLPEAEGSEGYYQTEKSSGRELSVLSIGESTIAGVGVSTHEEGFTGSFAKELAENLNAGVAWKVYAKSGYTAKLVTKKLIPKIVEKKVDLIVVGLGGNDAFTLNRPSKWKSDIRELIESLQLKFPQAMIVFCNMPPIKEFPAFTSMIKFTVGNLVEILGSELDNIVKAYSNVYYFGEKISLDTWIEKFDLPSAKEDFFSDGIHPSKLTYQTWAKAIALELTQNPQIKQKLLKS